MDSRIRVLLEIDIPETRELAEYLSINADMKSVMEFCDELLDLYKVSSEDTVLRHGLWIAALVTYFRSFSTGKRKGLGESNLQEIGAWAPKHHSFLKNMRDKHIAHSVNPFEQFNVGVILSDDEERIEGFGALCVRYLCPKESDEIEGLRRLASALMEKAQQNQKRCYERLHEIAPTLPIDDIRTKARKASIVVPDAEQSGKPR